MRRSHRHRLFKPSTAWSFWYEVRLFWGLNGGYVFLPYQCWLQDVPVVINLLCLDIIFYEQVQIQQATRNVFSSIFSSSSSRFASRTAFSWRRTIVDRNTDDQVEFCFCDKTQHWLACFIVKLIWIVKSSATFRGRLDGMKKTKFHSFILQNIHTFFK